MFNISIVITVHREKEFLFPAISSMEAALSKIPRHLVCEVLFNLDNSDEFTKDIVNSLAIDKKKILYTEFGDPSFARNNAIKESRGDYIALLDGDDLWSENWLSECIKYFNENPSLVDTTILHPEYNYIFDTANVLVRQGDANSDLFDTEFLRFSNYWDALCFTKKSIYDLVQYKANDKAKGIAHEDHLWVCETLNKDINHILVKDTVHFKRRRHGSVSSDALIKGAKVKPNSFSYYG